MPRLLTGKHNPMYVGLEYAGLALVADRYFGNYKALGFAVCALVYEEAIVKINKTATPTILGLTKTAASTVTVEGDAMTASSGGGVRVKLTPNGQATPWLREGLA